jgi:uncharacterized protein (TIGR03435 family)
LQTTENLRVRLTITATALLFLSTLDAQPQVQNDFEAASIKEVSRTTTSQRDDIRFDPSLISMSNVTLRSCLSWAYDLPYFRILGPDWASTTRFDIVAKAEHPADVPQLKVLLKKLLADRFRLQLHSETRSTSGYQLMRSRKEPLPNLRHSSSEGESLVKGQGRMGWTVRRTSMVQFAETLSLSMSMPVADATGLEGLFDFDLNLEPYFESGTTREDVRFALISAARSAIEEQLGLKLQPRKVPLEVLVIDRAERPTD